MHDTGCSGLVHWDDPKGWDGERGVDGITDLMEVSPSELREMVMDRKAWHAVIHGVAKTWTRLN